MIGFMFYLSIPFLALIGIGIFAVMFKISKEDHKPYKKWLWLFGISLFILIAWLVAFLYLAYS